MTDINENTSSHPEIAQFNKAAIKSAKEVMPSDMEMQSLSEIFKIMSDQTRLKIVIALMESEMCVYDLCHVVGISQSAVSHQLRVLRSARLAKFRKAGKMVFYSIDDGHVLSMLKQAIAHINHSR